MQDHERFHPSAAARVRSSIAVVWPRYLHHAAPAVEEAAATFGLTLAFLEKGNGQGTFISGPLLLLLQPQPLLPSQSAQQVPYLLPARRIRRQLLLLSWSKIGPPQPPPRRPSREVWWSLTAAS